MEFNPVHLIILLIVLAIAYGIWQVRRRADR